MEPADWLRMWAYRSSGAMSFRYRSIHDHDEGPDAGDGEEATDAVGEVADVGGGGRRGWGRTPVFGSLATG